MSTYQLYVDGTAVGSDVYDAIATLEVEEHAELPGALRIKLPVQASGKDISWVSDDRVRPFANLAIVATPGSGGSAQCIFDGYVLSHAIHLETGITSSSVEVTAQDSSVLMGVTPYSRSYVQMTDGAIANQIFASYGFQSDPGNTADDSPPRKFVAQRGTDIEFLRRLARRDGRWCRVACADTPGELTGYLAAPALDAPPVVTLDLNSTDKRQVNSLDFEWDVARPTEVAARQASLTDSSNDGFDAGTSDSGLTALDARTLADFAGRDTTAMLTAAAETDELPDRARALLRDAGWFARCEGTTAADLVGQVLRVGSVVAIQNVGNLLSGNYLVKRVKHAITAASHEMSFTLVRNAVGPAGEAQ